VKDFWYNAINDTGAAQMKYLKELIQFWLLPMLPGFAQSRLSIIFSKSSRTKLQLNTGAL